MKIGHLTVGQGSPPLIIAEMSGNHNGNLDRALSIVDAAAKAGVHAVKLQTYTADTMTLDISKREFRIEDEKSLWKGRSLYELYQIAHTPWEWHRPLFDRCRSLGLLAFSTPFDSTAVEFLEELNVPCYKIASFENIDIPLIRKAASTGKPLIISTGMATVSEIADAVSEARDSGAREMILLKCTSSYPASASESNVATIPHMRELFGCEVGLSDHTLGIGVAIASVAFGACVIEKHFTTSRTEGGVDAAFSLEPDEMRTLVSETNRAWTSIGKVAYGPSEDERRSLQFRRSLYITEDMKQGEPLTSRNLRAIRPGFGLPPKYMNVLMGKRVKRNIEKGTPMSWDLIE